MHHDVNETPPKKLGDASSFQCKRVTLGNVSSLVWELLLLLLFRGRVFFTTSERNKKKRSRHSGRDGPQGNWIEIYKRVITWMDCYRKYVYRAEMYIGDEWEQAQLLNPPSIRKLIWEWFELGPEWRTNAVWVSERHVSSMLGLSTTSCAALRDISMQLGFNWIWMGVCSLIHFGRAVWKTFEDAHWRLARICIGFKGHHLKTYKNSSMMNGQPMLVEACKLWKTLAFKGVSKDSHVPVWTLLKQNQKPMQMTCKSHAQIASNACRCALC